MGIAEKIIERAEQEESLAQDDLGFLVERNIVDDPVRLCRYLLVRILRRMGRPYRINNLLFLNGEEIGSGGVPIRFIKTAILRYADCPLPVRLSEMQVQWIYNRLYDLSAPMNNNMIQVADHLVFNAEKGIFEEYDR